MSALHTSPGSNPRQTTARLLIASAIVIALLGAATAAAGGWLVALDGSAYYLVAGVGWLAVGVLLWRRMPSALWLFAALMAATLAWALWEAGLDWWPLAARLDVPFVVGLILLTPWIARPLTGASGAARGALALVLGVTALVGAAAALSDPHRIDGRLPDAGGVETTAATTTPAGPPGEAERMPDGEWHAYGRTWQGQRYAPLSQITPDNVGKLELAWHVKTGDVRGRPGDPQETTYEVTPLKIGERIFLCTPHQLVIALDATSGREVWRYDPKILDGLALQHLTCRGLSYLPPGAQRAASADATTAAAQSASAPSPSAAASAPAPAASAAAGTRPNVPVAAATGPAVDSCMAGKLFMPTADGRVIALDPDSGRVCRDFGRGSGQIDLWPHMPNPRAGAYYSTSPVVVARGVLVVGGTVLDNVSVNEQSGVIRGYDAHTGELVWAWDPGRPDRSAPLPAGQTYVANSPNSWSIMAADDALGLVYVPLGNQPPDQWGGNRSPAVERTSSSVAALDLATGQLRWIFQTVHHDLWDYDVPSQPTLVDLTIDGARVPALVQPTKQGDLFVLDRRTGKPLLPVTEVPAPQGAAEGDRTAPTQPVSSLTFAPEKLQERDMWGATMFDQLACRIAFRQLRYEGRFTPPSTGGTLVHPGNFGVFNWGGIAVDPVRQVAFMMPVYLAFTSQLVARPNDDALVVNDERPDAPLPALNENFGAPFASKMQPFLGPLKVPCQAPPWGYVAGVDLRTGQIAWRHRNGTVRDLSPVPLPFRMGVPGIGGPIVTAGGVAFLSGHLDNFARAYDLDTGRLLWEHRLPAGGQATPMSYTGADGRQYVVFVAGGHGSTGTDAGDSIMAFALPRGTR